ncbi:alpha/beta hydrolase [Novosphingobium huizhouense]|uniref:alpha/beta hydrolase n=1 Tax=Novosphingobium huizhouense TaxID=2866625 RepID=UPI001CD8B28D|nr:alpha/beta hydrolase [Novosphingobium huizhouense]
MRLILATLLAATAYASIPVNAQPVVSRDTIPAPVQPGAIDLDTGAKAADREIWHLDGTRVSVRNVTRPTLVPFSPVGPASKAAVVIAPGGGFLGLAIEKEGWDVARWFANHGITAFVLKYRVLPTPPSQPDFASQLERMIRGEKQGVTFGVPDDTPPEALADGVAALRYVRSHAADYGIDPGKVGFMGFSAGGFLTRSVVARGGADMPAFAAPIYPSMKPLSVPQDAPPMFVAMAQDDFLLGMVKGFPLIDDYRAAGRPIEFHLFTSGGHGFGAGVRGTPTEDWLYLMLRWLTVQGFVEGTK